MNHTQRNKRRAACIAGGIGLCLLAIAGPVRAQIAPPLPVAPQEATPSAPESDAKGRLHLLVGRSLVISSPTRLKRVSIADPSIADAVIVNPSQILLNGRAPGGVSLVLWDESDQSQTFEVFVDMDILGISQKIREVFPNEPVRVEASKDLVMLSGQPSTKAVQNQIVQIVSAVAPKVISLMRSPAPLPTREILLEVKFAEVDRSALSQLGFNFFSPGTGRGPRSTVGATGTQQFGPPSLTSLTGGTGSGGSTAVTSNFNLNDLLNIFVFRPDIDLAAIIKALQQKSLLQILAEPNLLTENEKEASFLAGGEFPFPVVQGGAGGFNAVTIQFRQFGVQLNFTPTITEGDRIHLKVKPEVSSLDFTNALTISGFFVPALSTRRVETEMELADGESFAIAGLVDDRVTQVMSKVPGLGDIPILGQLFRSRSLNKSKTELLIVVTPRIVKPLAAGQLPPGPQFPAAFMPPATSGAPKPTVPTPNR
jgi:pilus assembly protein CpaC